VSWELTREEVEKIKQNWTIPNSEELPEIQKLILNLEERIALLEEELKVIKNYLKLGG